jgi:hypothetical protein
MLFHDARRRLGSGDGLPGSNLGNFLSAVAAGQGDGLEKLATRSAKAMWFRRAWWEIIGSENAELTCTESEVFSARANLVMGTNVPCPHFAGDESRKVASFSRRKAFTSETEIASPIITCATS